MIAQLKYAARLTSVSYQRMVPWLGLGCVLIFYVVSIVRLHPTNFFGFTEDDSIYFSSAKALAKGKGYILPSVPGTPSATHYPILYPWILSWVWRWNASFPGNLVEAVGLTVVFGLTFLVITFVFLRQLKGLGDWGGLLVTAFCALHPIVIYHSSSILSDIPFSALALAVMFLGDRAVERAAPNTTTVCCAVLAGLSMLMRVFGVPVAMGIATTALVRRAWRQFIVFCTAVAPFVVGLVWRFIFPRSSVPPQMGTASSMGWTRTWAYYTGYVTAWKVAIPNAHIFWMMLRSNAVLLLQGLSNYFLFPLLTRDTFFGRALVTVMSVVIVAGVVRQARSQKWRPVHFALLFYCAAILVWTYPLVDRFLLPFLPLFAAGMLLEGKHVVDMVYATFTRGGHTFERILGALIGAGIVTLGCGIALNYVDGERTLLDQRSKDRQALLAEKREAYDWLSRYTAANARMIAYEDASAYLYTGRVAMRPIVFTPAELYEEERLKNVVSHITDVARAIRADYWIRAEDDFGLEWKDAGVAAAARMTEIENVLPMVFRSKNGHVRIYRLDCIQNPEDPSCHAAIPVLFPNDFPAPTAKNGS